MGKATAGQRRASGGKFELWPANASHGWQPVRRGILFSEGLYMVARGKWALRERENGTPWYFQLLRGVAKERRHQRPGARVLLEMNSSSPAAVTAKESELNAQESATAHMGEEKKLARHGTKFDPDKPLPPEDAVELAQAKVRVWGETRLAAAPLIGGSMESEPFEVQVSWDAFADRIRRRPKKSADDVPAAVAIADQSR